MEKLLEDARSTGKLKITRRKLRDLPRNIVKYDLKDTIYADLSFNRLVEFPKALCDFLFIEEIVCSNNVLKHIPAAISQLQFIRLLDLSRNHLSILPVAVCCLASLETLRLRANRLLTLPEDICGLVNLAELDVSNNQLSCLPPQIGQLSLLRILDVKHNLLQELPSELCTVPLRTLDVSHNRLTSLPLDLRFLENCLDELHVDQNPLQCPPIALCYRGLRHVCKLLAVEAARQGFSAAAVTIGLSNSNSSNVGFLSRTGMVQRSASSSSVQSQRCPPSMRLGAAFDSGYSTAGSSCETVVQHTRASWTHTEDESHSEETREPPITQVADLFSTELARARQTEEMRRQRASTLRSELGISFGVVNSVASTSGTNNFITTTSHHVNRHNSTPTLVSSTSLSTPVPSSTPKPVQFSSTQSVFARLDEQRLRGMRRPINSSVSTSVTSSSSIAGTSSPENSRCNTPSTESIATSCVSSRPMLIVTPGEAEAAIKTVLDSCLGFRLPSTSDGAAGPAELCAALRDGVVLCHLANRLWPRSVPIVHVPVPGQPALPLSKARRNLQSFLDACRRMGMSEAQLFSLTDFLSGERGLARLARTVVALNHLASRGVDDSSV